MPIKQLVAYFNARLRAEHGLDRWVPLISRRHRVEGHFAGLRLASAFDPVRLTDAPSIVVGHIARLRTLGEGYPDGRLEPVPHDDPGWVVNFDRLCRTLHMLNYLAHRGEDEGVLFLDVNPRHILGVPRNHGAYFSEVIHACGLATQDVVLSMPWTAGLETQQEVLTRGLNNYRRRGYRIALRVDDFPPSKATVAFLLRIAPDHLRVSTRLNMVRRPATARPTEPLSHLHRVAQVMGARMLLEDIADEATARQARDIGIEWLQGSFWEHCGLRDRRHEGALSAAGGVYVQAV